MINNKPPIFLSCVLFSFFLTSNGIAKNYGKTISNVCFEATQDCPAYQSFRKQTNPGNVRLEKNKQYSIVEENKSGTRYRIKIDGIKRPKRWVESQCGTRISACGGKNSDQVKTSKKPSANNKKHKKKVGQYLLALSWQPTFCESHSRKKECRALDQNKYSANNLSLHGLWPQPRANAYCGVSETDKGIDRNKRWHLLEPLKLSSDVIKKLPFIMPGYASNLHRHEWIKHGTCYGTDADTYYDHSIALTEQINQSKVGQLLSKNIGKRITLKQVRKAFDQSFGKGAGKRVDLRCDRKGRIGELWVNLKGVVTDKTSSELDISTLLESALRAGSTCQAGILDEAD